MYEMRDVECDYCRQLFTAEEVNTCELCGATFCYDCGTVRERRDGRITEVCVGCNH